MARTNKPTAKNAKPTGDTPAPASLQHLSTALLHVWEGNNRTASEQGLAALTASIAADGILQPLLGRPDADYYDIICGARRLAAARAAGLETVPVYIRNLTDAQAAAAVAAENIIREDFTPLDAYAAVKATLDAYGDAQAAADHLAAPIGWVRRVAQLEHLCGQWFSEAANLELSLGFLAELARLPEHVQDRIFNDYSPRSDFTNDGGNLRMLRQIVGQFTSSISASAWLKGDKACAICARRTDAEPELFPEYEPDDACCLDSECRDAKREAFISAQRTAAAAKSGTTPDKVKTAQWEKHGDKAKKSASHTVPVVIEQGPESGKIVWREPDAEKASTDATPKGPSPQSRLAAKFIRQVEAAVKEETRVISWLNDASAEQVMALMLITGLHPQDGGHTSAAIMDDFRSNQSDAPENIEFIADALRPRILEKLRFSLVSDCDAAYQWAAFFSDLLVLPVDAPLKGAQA